MSAVCRELPEAQRWSGVTRSSVKRSRIAVRPRSPPQGCLMHVCAMNDQPILSQGTRAVWAGEEQHDFWERSTQVPLVHSVSFGYPDVDSWLDAALGRTPGHIYGRNTNPTVAVFEEKVRQLEGAEAATSFATGMAAISNTLFTLLAPGDRVVSIKDSYGGTNK